MKVCIIGNNLVSLTLAKALLNKGLSVDIYYKKSNKIYDQTRTIGISKSNVEYFNNLFMINNCCVSKTVIIFFNFV